MLKILHNTNCANMHVTYGEDSDEIFSYKYAKMDRCKISFIINSM